MQVLAGKGPRLILELPLACFSPDLEPYISAIMRHILEDPATLQAAMEAEIRSTLSKGRVPKPSGYPSGAQCLRLRLTLALFGNWSIESLVHIKSGPTLCTGGGWAAEMYNQGDIRSPIVHV